MSFQNFAEAAVLKAKSTALLTEIRDLSVRVSAIPPLIQEFRDKVAAAAHLAPSRPTNVTNNIVIGTANFSSSRTIHVSQ
jgi:hypothetical protein